MEPGRRGGGGDDSDVVRQGGVERLGGASDRGASNHIDRGHLCECVHAGVGSPRDGELRPASVEPIKGVVELRLDRAQTRLAGPASELRPVVLEC